MNQELEWINHTDGDGNPAGGYVEGVGLQIRWQNGPLGRDAERAEPNGAFVESVLAAALQRIEWYQTASDGRFACKENANAIIYIDQALSWLNKRTAAREARKVEGTHAP